MVGIPRKEYEAAVLFARMTVKEHQDLGTPRNLWEPTPTQNYKMAASFIADGEQQLARGLEREADPSLDTCHELVGNVQANLDEIAEHGRPLGTADSGARYSVAEAVERVGEQEAAIRQDLAAGRHHHYRVSVLLQRLAALAPWVEAAGFLAFIAYYLNVPLLQPWQDWLDWSFGFTVVVIIIIGQTWLVRHTAANHNHAREARAQGHRNEADKGFTRRNWYLGLTAVTAVAIATGMIWRGASALGSATISTTAVMIFVAAVTGLLLPSFAYVSTALDGSKVSRERDGLTADLDDDLDAYLETISNIRRDLADVAEIGATLKDSTFPDICSRTQETVDGVYELYGTVRLLIGGLSAPPPSRATNASTCDPAGHISGYIGTSIPGTGRVSLDPLFDRQHRLEEIETQRTSLLDLLNDLPPHPWASPRRAW